MGLSAEIERLEVERVEVGRTVLGTFAEKFEEEVHAE